MSLFRSALLLRQVPSRVILGGVSSQRGLQTSSTRMGKVEKVTVIGSGLMGSGIAQVRRPAGLVGNLITDPVCNCDGLRIADSKTIYRSDIDFC